MLDRRGAVEQFLICFRDVSALREAVSQSKIQEEKLTFLMTIWKLGNITFFTSMDHAQSFLQSAEEAVSGHSLSNDDRQRVFLSTHSLKGLVRSLSIRSVTELCHSLEDTLESPDLEPRVVTDFLQQIAKELKEVENLVAESFQWSRSRQHVKVPRELYETAIHDPDISELSPAWLHIRDHFITESRADLKGLLLDCGAGIDGIARKLGKEPPELVLQGPEIFLTEKVRKSLKGAFVHIIRNALDHGIESKASRLQQNKTPQGRISVSWQWDGEQLLIETRDDGQGINLKKIRQDLNWSSDKKLSTDEIEEVLFASGFSTAEKISEISGRGVGMVAIRDEVRNLGGDLTIKDDESFQKDSVNFCLQIRLPIILFQERKVS